MTKLLAELRKYSRQAVLTDLFTNDPAIRKQLELMLKRLKTQSRKRHIDNVQKNRVFQQNRPDIGIPFRFP